MPTKIAFNFDFLRLAISILSLEARLTVVGLVYIEKS